MVIVESAEERAEGLEDAPISPMALDGFRDRIEYCSDIFSKAAVAVDYIAIFHPFVEGNKRTAFQLVVNILDSGGYELDDDDKTYHFIRDVASGMISGEEIEAWLRCNTHFNSP